MPLPRFNKLDAQRQRAILDAAAHEFGEHGFANASYNQIIDRAGISKGAMYYYFADKDDLYRTVLTVATDAWFAATELPELPTDAEGFWDAVETIYAQSLEYMLSAPANAALCLGIIRARERLEGHPALRQLNQRTFEFIEQIAVHGQHLGAVRTDLPNDMLIHMAFALLDGGDRWLAAHWDEFSADDIPNNTRIMVGLLRRLGEKEAS